ncbi:MAG: (Fe-S)-binding protein [Deltaproteobacteria bacterium]|jgi:glycolate oxidase iron-sulfur subunit|nr:(Fe-S)-binding protein [Deltaproteobacteria bacterium]
MTPDIFQDPKVISLGKKLSLTELISHLNELDDLLIHCTRCGFCQEVCPVYGATLREADVTRGKIALLEDLALKITKDVVGVGERLNRCLLCTSCENICPSGVKIMDIFIRARTIVTAYRGLGPVKRAIFHFLLKHPRIFNELTRLAAIFQFPFLKRQSDLLQTYSLPLVRPLFGGRHIPAFPGESFTKSYPSLRLTNAENRFSVLYFPGCVPDKLFRNISEATLRVLKFHKVGIIMPEDLNCCGIPCLSSGDEIGFLTLMQQNLKKIREEKFSFLVTSCATCASTIKEIWPRFRTRFTLENLKTLDYLKDHTLDITSFLIKVLKIQDHLPNEPLPDTATPKLRVTYHDPCHLYRSMGISNEPRTILKSLKAYEYVEMPEANHCCGNGGSFNLFHYDISKQIGQRKRDNIVKVKPDIVATSCPACMLQIMDSLSQNQDDILVKHVVELYAQEIINKGVEGKNNTF